MTKQEFWKLFNEKYAEYFMELWERWQEERYYEDFNDYLEVMKKTIKETEILKMTKRPFAIVCKCSNGNIFIQCKSAGNYLRIIGKSVA